MACDANNCIPGKHIFHRFNVPVFNGHIHLPQMHAVGSGLDDNGRVIIDNHFRAMGTRNGQQGIGGFDNGFARYILEPDLQTANRCGPQGLGQHCRKLRHIINMRWCQEIYLAGWIFFHARLIEAI